MCATVVSHRTCHLFRRIWQRTKMRSSNNQESARKMGHHSHIDRTSRTKTAQGDLHMNFIRSLRLGGLGLVLLFTAILAQPAFTAEMRVLAIRGDGTATVLVAGDTAQITDGGRGAESGIAGAKIGDQDVLDFLLNEAKVQKLVILCSHPHADHMEGLRKILGDERILSFSSIVFVDNDYQGSKKKTSLHSEFVAKWGERPSVKYVRAWEWRSVVEKGLILSAFVGREPPSPKDDGPRPTKPQGPSKPNGGASGPKGDELGPDSTRPGPKDEPPPDGSPAGSGPSAPVKPNPGAPSDPHATAIISEYVFSGDNKIFLAVDLDDASKARIRDWLAVKPKVNALLISHHGSTHNYVPELLSNRAQSGLRDVIFTVNDGNQYFHPDADVLLEALNKLGANHVFITGSKLGDNVSISEGGVKVDYDNRKHLAAFIDRQITRSEVALRNIAEAAAAKLTRSEVDEILSSSNVEEALLSKARALEIGSQKRLQWASKAVKALPLLAQAAAIVSDDETRRPYYAERYAGILDELRAVASRPQTGSNGGNEFLKKFEETKTEIAVDERRKSSSPATASSNRSKGDLFAKTLSLTLPTWGGVIVGNVPQGVRPESLEYVVVDRDLAQIAIRFRYANGQVADYEDLTNSELWAAHEFVQPDEVLTKEYPGLVGNAVGVAGAMEAYENENPDTVIRFALHPSVAGLPIGDDSMRLDLSLRGAQIFRSESWLSLRRSGIRIPSHFRKAPWIDYPLDAYQWFDAPAKIVAQDGRLVVTPAEGPQACLMRVRIVEVAKPSWCSPKCDKEHMQREFERRAEATKQRVQREYDAEIEELKRTISHIELPGSLSNGGNLALQEYANRLGTKYDTKLKEAIERLPSEMATEARNVERDQSHSDSEKMLPFTDDLCRFDGATGVDRFARIVAILNLFGNFGERPLPALPTLLLPERKATAAALAYADVFPRDPPSAWLSIVSISIGGAALFLLLATYVMRRRLFASGTTAVAGRQGAQVSSTAVAAAVDEPQPSREQLNEHTRLAESQLTAGDRVGALLNFRAAVMMCRKIADTSTEDTAQHELALLHNRLGDVQRSMEMFADSLASFEASLKITDRLVAAAPNDISLQRELAVSHNKIGKVRLERKEIQAALESFLADTAISRSLAELQPDNDEFQRDLATSHATLGDAYLAAGDSSAALVNYREGLKIRERLAAASAGDFDRQLDLISACMRVGRSLKVLNTREAREILERGLDALRAIASSSVLPARAAKWEAAFNRELEGLT